MSARLIEVSSRATGERRRVRVYVYDTVDELRSAGERFNGEYCADAIGMCQLMESGLVDRDGRRSHARSTTVIVRLCRGHLGTSVVVHEMNHAAVAIYGSNLRGNELAIDLLNHHNETLAHLQSDLTRSLVDRLYALGYYDEGGQR